MRTRRRRLGLDSEEGQMSNDQPLLSNRVKFIEQVDYKMEILEGDTTEREVKIVGN